jgi:uncharacterized protein with GYD domain
MSAYVTLFNFTDQGARAAKDTTKRLRAFAQSVEAAGGRFIGGWWLLGAYDGVIVWQAPDGETATRLALATGMLGNVRTTTMEAFGEEEMARIVQKLP